MRSTDNVTAGFDMVNVTPPVSAHVTSAKATALLPVEMNVVAIGIAFAYAPPAVNVKLVIVICWPAEMLMLSSVMSPPPPVAEIKP